MTSRITRNNGTTNLASENKNIGGGKKMAGNSGGRPTKRKSEDDLQTEQKNKKRAAFGDITNATAGNLKAQVKKGLTNIVSKSKGSLMVRETKASVLRQTSANKKKTTTTAAVKEKEKEEEEEASLSGEVLKNSQSSSSSSETILVTDSDSSSTSSLQLDSTVKEESDEAAPAPAPAPVFSILSPARPPVPEGVIDFDLETAGDPQQHSEYAMETFQYYKNREEMFRVPSYITAQGEITEAMRSILVDWLVEVQESFELNHETLYTAVKMTDLYLSKKQVRKEDLQLVGATACLISSKVDERIPPMVDDFLYVCDDAYSRDQLMKMERKMLAVVGFDLGYSLSYRFLRRYGRVCKVTMPVLTLARYILESSLMEYSMNVDLSESLLAASALVLAFKIKGIEGWVPTLRYYSGFSPEELVETVDSLLEMLRRPVKENLKTVRSKYSHKVFHEVASIPLPEAVTLTSQG